MSKERELLERSIELIDQYWDDSKVGYPRDADNRKLFYEIEELLTQPEQSNEPVAWLHEWVNEIGEHVKSVVYNFYDDANLIPLYTAPPKREPLSKEQYMKFFTDTYDSVNPITDFVRAIEKAHGITGGGE